MEYIQISKMRAEEFSSSALRQKNKVLSYQFSYGVFLFFIVSVFEGGQRYSVPVFENEMSSMECSIKYGEYISP